MGPMLGIHRRVRPQGRDARSAGRSARPLPPDGGVEVRDLVDRQRVDAAREVLPAVVADDEDDVALVHLAGDATAMRAIAPDETPAKRPSSSSSLRVQMIASRLVTKIFRSSSERSMIGGMKPSSSERRPWTGSPCIGSAATIFTRSPSSSLKRRALPISVPPVPRPATNASTLAVELLEDLERRAVVVRARVGLVAVLVGHVVRRVGLRPSRAPSRRRRWSPGRRASRRSRRRTSSAAACAPA